MAYLLWEAIGLAQRNRAVAKEIVDTQLLQLTEEAGRRRRAGGGRGREGLTSSAQHHRGDGPTSSLGPVSMGREQRAVCKRGLVVGVEAAALLKLDWVEADVERGRGRGGMARSVSLSHRLVDLDEARRMGGGLSSTQHHRRDGPTS